MSLEIKYELTGVGWAEAEFAMPNKKININISYLSNPLPEIIKGILNISQSKTAFVEVLFSDEPGELKLQITKVSKNEIQLSFYSHPEALFSSVDPAPVKRKSTTILECTPLKIQDYIHEGSYQCSLKELICSVIVAVDNLILKVPIREYKSIWTMPFPRKAYSDLKTLA